MSCKGCEVKEEAGAVDVALLIEEQLAVETNLAPQTVVDHRVQICQQCPYRLQQTCTKCGCYYEFRANLNNKNCPVNQW